jgi:hypothetical protein
VHAFTAIGDEPLVQLDIHMSPTFIQENLDVHGVPLPPV